MVLVLLILFFHTTFSSEISYNELKSHTNWNLLPHETCGRRALDSAIEPRAGGGQNAAFGEFPWMVALFDTERNQRRNIPICGGAIISERYILTAAHCCEDMEPGKSRVRVGEYDLDHDGPECGPLGCSDPVKNFGVEEISSFLESYEDSSHDDICLLRLSESIQFNEYVRPICLPIYGNLIITEGDEVQFAGWGISDMFQKGSTLQKINISVVSEEDCRITYPSVAKKEFCARGRKKNMCLGDSGGALVKAVSLGGKTTFYAIGVLSQSITVHRRILEFRFCPVEAPGYFAKVTEYTIWILNTIRH